MYVLFLLVINFQFMYVLFLLVINFQFMYVLFLLVINFQFMYVLFLKSIPCAGGLTDLGFSQELSRDKR